MISWNRQILNGIRFIGRLLDCISKIRELLVDTWLTTGQQLLSPAQPATHKNLSYWEWNKLDYCDELNR